MLYGKTRELRGPIPIGNAGRRCGHAKCIGRPTPAAGRAPVPLLYLCDPASVHALASEVHLTWQCPPGRNSAMRVWLPECNAEPRCSISPVSPTVRLEALTFALMRCVPWTQMARTRVGNLVVGSPFAT